MHIQPTRLPGAALIEPERRQDERGWFARVYCAREFLQHKLPNRLVQTNRSLTRRAGTLRGMHYQLAPHGEDKLVRCEHGAIWDAIVDLRPDSATYGQWLGVELSEDNGRMLLVPRGFAHGFVVTSESAEFLYKTSDYWYPEHERSLLWCDPTVGIQWPSVGAPKLAAKDAAGKVLAEADAFA